MASSAAALCARALITLGARPISSLDETGTEAEVCRRLYPGIRDGLVSAHPWHFATAQARLPRLATAPAADYAHAFQLPPDFLRALSAGEGPRGRGLTYRLTGRQLHADSPRVMLTYILRPHESDFPPFFDQLLVARLAADLCLPLTESTSRAEALARLAANEFERARRVDSQQNSPARLESFPLVEVRGA